MESYHMKELKNDYRGVLTGREHVEIDEEESNQVDSSGSSGGDRNMRELKLERSFKEETEFACDHWIGRRVETYWGDPPEMRGFYPGVIMDWKQTENDIEYLVKYDCGSDTPAIGYEWESVDEGLRFENAVYDRELQRALKLRRLRGVRVEVDIENPSNLGNSKAKRTRVGVDFQVELLVSPCVCWWRWWWWVRI
eukprot:TRINITY_DN4895_c0_g1_i1.p1 TRINITY_DN4895_c0_g1~~TRINITY_DN4895_c0_g1_i1.p1  ORF type:complete len:195 (-),score=41.31 TRINITY_DN4895_c0_g1_i1:603-1187(-)